MKRRLLQCFKSEKKSDASHFFFPCREESKACSFAKRGQTAQPTPGLAVAARPACVSWEESSKISTPGSQGHPSLPWQSQTRPASCLPRGFSEEWEQAASCCWGREPEHGSGTCWVSQASWPGTGLAHPQLCQARAKSCGSSWSHPDTTSLLQSRFFVGQVKGELHSPSPPG